MGDLWGRRPPVIADRETHVRMRFVLKNTRRRRPPVKRNRRIVTKFSEFAKSYFHLPVVSRGQQTKSGQRKRYNYLIMYINIYINISL